MPGWRNSGEIESISMSGWQISDRESLFSIETCPVGEIESISTSWSLQTAIFGPDVTIFSMETSDIALQTFDSFPVFKFDGFSSPPRSFFDS